MPAIQRTITRFPARTLALACALGAILGLSPTGFAQAPYTYIVIADLGATDSAFPPSINNNGQVAFITTTSGIVYRGDGNGAPIAIYSFESGRPGPTGHASINADGLVAFRASGPPFGAWIVVGDGTAPAAVIAMTGAAWDVVRNPSINDQGDVVFEASPSSTTANFVVMGSAFDPIASPGNEVTGGTITSASGPKINNSGAVGFTANLSDGSQRIFRTSSAGVTLMGPASASGELTFGMNDSGIVAFWSGADGGSIVTSDGVTQTPIFVRSPGLQPQPHRVGINDADTVVFMTSDGTGGPNRVFAGDGTLFRQVMQVDDSILGLGTVLSVSISNDAINDFGQVAVLVSYDDGSGVTKYAVVRASLANAAPVADDGTASTNEDTAVSGALAASDANDDPLTFSIVANGTLGTATLTNPMTGAFTYTPNPNAFGSDAFTFQANDGAADSNEATVTVAIAPVNDAPVAQDGVASTYLQTPVAGTLVATDIDGAGLTFAFVANGGKGTATITNAFTGAYTYVPAAGQSGLDTFTFRANDGTLDSNVAAIIVTIAPNRPPVATDGTVTTREDRSATGTLSASDPDGHALVFSIVSNGTLGTATITNAAMGRYSYVPQPNRNGTDTFTFRASDGTDVSSVATVSVTITPVNDAPVAAASTASTSVNTPVSGALTAVDPDVADTLSFAVVKSPKRGTVIVQTNGSFVYTPRPGFVGSDTFTFRANDGMTSSNQATVTLTVQ